MNIRVVIDFDPKANAFSAYCPELPGCASAGDTEEEALKNIREAIELYLEPSPLAPAPSRSRTALPPPAS